MTNVLHPRVTTTIDTRLRANGAAMWSAAWRAVVARSVVVPRAMALFNAETISLGADWSSLDDEADRHIRARAAGIEEAVVEELLLQRDAFDTAFQEAGLRAERAAGLRRHLHPLVVQLIADPLSEIALRGFFPWAWRFVAAAIARDAHARRLRLGPALEDWRALNERLAAGFFASCMLDRASLVGNVLARIAGEWPLGIRGRFVRLAEQVSAHGIDDVVPPIVAPPVLQPPVHAALSDVIASAAQAWTTAEQGHGVMHQLLGAKITAVPASGLPAGRTLQELIAARSAAYRQHEYTVASYLALVSIEQLLRGMAERAGVDHVDHQVLDWIDQIGATPVIREAVSAIYDRGQGNIRNRFVHAGLLDIESKRMEQVLVAAGLRSVALGNDPYAPRNVAALCVSALSAIDAELARTGPLTAAHFGWAPGLDLTAAELRLAAGLPFDFARPGGIDLQRQMSDFLTVVAPATSQLFRLGFVGWTQRTNPNTLPMFVSMLVVFEGVARMVVHLCGLPVLQWDDRHGRCQYLMFDRRGLASPTVRNRVCGELPLAARDVADQAITLALKVRNAFAHGAVLSPAGTYFDAIGQLVTKASLAFMLAGENHMIREAAYLKGEQSGRGDVDNWLAAEDRVLGNIAAAAVARRRP